MSTEDDVLIRLYQPGLSFAEWAEMQVATGKLLLDRRSSLWMVLSLLLPVPVLYAIVMLLALFDIELGFGIASGGEIISWFEPPSVAAIVACLTIITISVCVRTYTFWIWWSYKRVYGRMSSIHGQQMVAIRKHDIEFANSNGTSRVSWEDILHRIRGRSGLWYLVNRNFGVFWISEKTIEQSDNPAELRNRLGIP